MIRHASVGLAVALTLGIPGVVEAGVQNIPCKAPFVFSTAAVNVVVLPYEAAQVLPAAGLGDKLSALFQMEVTQVDRQVRQRGCGADGRHCRGVQSRSGDREIARAEPGRKGDRG